MRDAAARHLVPIAVEMAREGDVVLFRMTRGGVAKHAAILTAPNTMIHAYSGHAVMETALTDWWRRRRTYAFSFPDGID